MQKSAFQKIFFGLIFVVTIGAFIQMYVEHSRRVEQMDCVERTRDLLDYLTEGKGDREWLIWPDDPHVRDSATVLLKAWGREARFDGYHHEEVDSGYTEEILVFYPGVKAGPEPKDPALKKVGVRVTWLLDNRRTTWRAALALEPIK